MVVMGVWAFIFCTGHRWRKTKEQQPSRFSKQIFPEKKKKEVFCFTSSVSSVHDVVTGIWKPLIFGHIVNSFGQGKCAFDCQSGNFKNYSSGNHFSTSLCMLRTTSLCMLRIDTDHLQHDFYVDISNKSTLAWVFVSHACTCTQITVNSFINNLVLITRIHAVLMRVPHIP